MITDSKRTPDDVDKDGNGGSGSSISAAGVAK